MQSELLGASCSPATDVAAQHCKTQIILPEEKEEEKKEKKEKVHTYFPVKNLWTSYSPFNIISLLVLTHNACFSRAADGGVRWRGAAPERTGSICYALVICEKLELMLLKSIG